MIRKLIIGVITYFILACTGLSPAFALALNIPYNRIQDAIAAAESVNGGLCPNGGQVLDLWIKGKSETQEFRLLSGDKVFAFIEIGPEGVVQVFIGKVVNHDELVVTEVLDLAGALARYPGGPCTFLYPEGA